MFLVAQIAVTVFTFMGLFGGDVTPVGNTARAMLVYILPLLIAANLLLLVYWLVRRRWLYAIVPVFTVACCVPYLGTIFQPGLGDRHEANAKKGLKIATYNVARFSRETSGFIAQDILAEMRRQDVDILCMQEYEEHSGDKLNSESYLEYFNYMVTGRKDMVIYSRYPITNSKTFKFDDTNNSAMWADVDIKGSEYRIVNVHLQTTGINRTLHQADKLAQLNYDVSTNKLLSTIYDNYVLGLMVRAGQAITIANECRSSKFPIILCGDFNDVPYSYVYNTVLGDMVDGFRECGSGWMYTRRAKSPIRIDYIFHDKELEGLAYYTSELTYSDHYPVFMKIAM